MFLLRTRNALLIILTTAGLTLQANESILSLDNSYDNSFGYSLDYEDYRYPPSCEEQEPSGNSCNCIEGAPFFMHLWPGARLYGSLEAGYKRFKTPGFDRGELTNLATISTDYPPFHIGKRDINGPYTTAVLGCMLPSHYDVCWLGDYTVFEIGGSWWQAHDNLSSSSQFPIPAGRTGLFTNLINPALTSITIPTGTDTFNNLVQDYNYREGNFCFRTNYICCWSDHLWIVQPFVGASFNKFIQDYDAHFTTNALDVGLEEHLRSKYVDFGGGLGIQTLLWNCLSLGVSAGGYSSYANTDLHVVQNSVLAPISFIEARIHRHQWSGKFKGSAELGWRLCKTFLSVIGNYEYWGYMPQVVNPLTPLSPPVQIHKVNSYNWSIGIKITAPILSRL